MTALLQVQNLSLQATGRALVQALSFEARAGERWAVIGRNAAGKSTLLRALAGLDVPQVAGQIRLQGQALGPRNARAAARLRAYMPQQTSDRFDLPVQEYLALHGSGIAPIEQTASQLDVAHLLARPVTQLSGGERQRVGLCAVALQGAPLWLLDEPVSFQDPAHQKLVGDWLRSHADKCQIMVAHDMHWVQRFATHIIACNEDATWATGPIGNMLSAHLLQALYGCAWRQVEGVWLPE
jgi:iron complex transport system ATP-binding protein